MYISVHVLHKRSFSDFKPSIDPPVKVKFNHYITLHYITTKTRTFFLTFSKPYYKYSLKISTTNKKKKKFCGSLLLVH